MGVRGAGSDSDLLFRKALLSSWWLSSSSGVEHGCRRVQGGVLEAAEDPRYLVEQSFRDLQCCTGR